MFSKIRFIGKLSQQYETIALVQKVCKYSESNTSPKDVTNIETVNSHTEIPDDEHAKKPLIVDINIDDMMYDDPELERVMRLPTTEHGQPDGPTINNTDINGAPIAPVDVNPWLDEEDMAQGTVDFENIERMRKQPIEYPPPPPPEKRDNSFKCKGIQIRLPHVMLTTNGTYRYRLDEEDEHLPDDMHICKF